MTACFPCDESDMRHLLGEYVFRDITWILESVVGRDVPKAFLLVLLRLILSTVLFANPKTVMNQAELILYSLRSLLDAFVDDDMVSLCRIFSLSGYSFYIFFCFSFFPVASSKNDSYFSLSFSSFHIFFIFIFYYHFPPR